ILAGDALLAEAFSCLAASFGRPENLIEIIRDIAGATGAGGMTGGQLLDMEAAGKKITYDDLRNIHRGKTGALITVSVTSGAKAAAADKKQLAALTTYGKSIGLAFQISDDILDIEGTTEELGKPAKSDIGNKKSTYPSILGVEKSKKLAKEQIDAAYSALAEFDAKADPLREIARYIINRKS
ncbi:MAG: polyprenyl synthetase family protein, partial [Deltaproteobacteria bacterium]|nr:polyprenyl synthetase family protein [Deltaproteobacteria bacterium]